MGNNEPRAGSDSNESLESRQAIWEYRVNFILSRLTLVFVGVAVGLLARAILGPPASETENDWEIRPIHQMRSQQQDADSDASSKTNRDVSMQRGGTETPFDDGSVSGGLVAPISTLGSASYVSFDDFEHDPSAAFHPHGEKLCASGCAASRHPTEKLSVERFQELLNEFTIEPMDSTNNALEELLYYGRQAQQMLDQYGTGRLSNQQIEFLRQELAITHAKVQIRLVDQDGNVRSWLPETRVPFDRRHVFEMQTNNLQDLVTSGTVKRVGLKHLWTRL